MERRETGQEGVVEGSDPLERLRQNGHDLGLEAHTERDRAISKLESLQRACIEGRGRDGWVLFEETVSYLDTAVTEHGGIFTRDEYGDVLSVINDAHRRLAEYYKVAGSK